MSREIPNNSGIVFMKVGVHAQEPLEEIIERKRAEIDAAGYALWGYGGNTCHPRTMVQPFARERSAKGQPILLCMQRMQSNHFAEPIRARYYSADGDKWDLVPDAINVLGSRFALAIRSLRQEESDLPLSQTRVAIGNSQGRAGDRYISGRVDKGCLEVISGRRAPPGPQETTARISLVAELCEPYAVFLKN